MQVWDSALRRREDQPHEIAKEQHLPGNNGRVLQHETAFDGCLPGVM
jgi:hypothetical protein